MRVGSIVGVVCAAAFVAAGCGTQSVDGQAGAEGVSAGDPAFSPCDDIPDEVVREVGVDPATEERDIDGIDQPGWNICSWSGPKPALAVFATNYTLDDVRAKEGNVAFTPLDIPGRTGFAYRQKSDIAGRNCDVALESADGSVLVSTTYLGIDPITEDACVVATRRAHTLVEYIPE
ncbi:DUF3558 domain-containing protein [Rhodococcus sp. NPDC003318]|uniref:DUF3558 domain-containing protein n=1 Tax=Rhodococcus sp. NPDC003318 TaxID=3364503 RepID=UPI0036C69098